MTVLVAIPDGREGTRALLAGIEEARTLSTDLLVLNLTLNHMDLTPLPDDLKVEVLERSGAGDRDPADAVLDELADRPGVTRLVIGLRRRSPVSKALLGSISQRLLLESPIPVLAVKPED
jgi:nucleotide-binding universal stress UspA family protein